MTTTILFGTALAGVAACLLFCCWLQYRLMDLGNKHNNLIKVFKKGFTTNFDRISTLEAKQDK